MRTCDSVAGIGEMVSGFHGGLVGRAYADGWCTPIHGESQRQFGISISNSPSKSKQFYVCKKDAVQLAKDSSSQPLW